MSSTFLNTFVKAKGLATWETFVLFLVTYTCSSRFGVGQEVNCLIFGAA